MIGRDAYCRLKNLRLEISHYNNLMNAADRKGLIAATEKDVKALEKLREDVLARLDTEATIERRGGRYYSPIKLPCLLASFKNPRIEIVCTEPIASYLKDSVMNTTKDDSVW
jgi:hypothetical protein